MTCDGFGRDEIQEVMEEVAQKKINNAKLANASFWVKTLEALYRDYINEVSDVLYYREEDHYREKAAEFVR